MPGGKSTFKRDKGGQGGSMFWRGGTNKGKSYQNNL